MLICGGLENCDGRITKETVLDSDENLIARPEKAEVGLDVAAVVAGLVPWVGGAISSVLSGVSHGRKMKRVEEVLVGFAGDMKDVKSQAAKDYVKTEDFEELLEKTILAVADERNEQKRAIFRAFLVDAVVAPGETYDDQIRVVRVLQVLSIDHIRILAACSEEPNMDSGMFSSRSQTLASRVPGIPADQLTELVEELNGLRVTKLEGLNMMVTASGAADLRFGVASLGRRLLRHIVDG